MGHLHQIVDLAPRPYPCLTQQRSVDGAVRTDLDIVFDDDMTAVFELHMGVVVEGIPEPVTAHDHPSMQDASFAQDTS